MGSVDALEKAFRSNMKKIRKDTRKIVEEQLLVEKVRQGHFQGIKLSRREVESFYNTYKDSLPSLKESVVISHILFFNSDIFIVKSPEPTAPLFSFLFEVNVDVFDVPFESADCKRTIF